MKDDLKICNEKHETVYYHVHQCPVCKAKHERLQDVFSQGYSEGYEVGQKEHINDLKGQEVLNEQDNQG